MENIAHRYLTKLRIISKIPENGQLDLTNNDLNIYKPSLVNWISRKMGGDGKANTVSFLRSFYQELILFTDELMASSNADRTALAKRNRYALLATIAKKIKESQIGFANLKKTYAAYPKIISMLESVEQDLIDTQLRNIASFLLDRATQKDASDPISIEYDSPEVPFAPPPPANTPNEII